MINKKWEVPFYGSLYLSSVDKFYVLDYTEWELQAREMFPGLMLKAIWRAKMNPFTQSPHTTSGPVLSTHWWDSIAPESAGAPCG